MGEGRLLNSQPASVRRLMKVKGLTWTRFGLWKEIYICLPPTPYLHFLQIPSLNNMTQSCSKSCPSPPCATPFTIMHPLLHSVIHSSPPPYLLNFPQKSERQKKTGTRQIPNMPVIPQFEKQHQHPLSKASTLFVLGVCLESWHQRQLLSSGETTGFLIKQRQNNY